MDQTERRFHLLFSWPKRKFFLLFVYPRSTLEFFKLITRLNVFVCSRSIWLIWCWFLRRGENRESVYRLCTDLPSPQKNRFLLREGGVCTQARRKTSRSKGENQQQTQPTYGVDAEIWTRATLVGGECSHHRATPALLETWTCAQVDFVKRWPNQNGLLWKPWRNRRGYYY